MRQKSNWIGWLGAVMLAALLVVAIGTVALGAQQPVDGFVPIDQLPPEEQMPAAPLVIAAYAVAWVAVFGYLWSIWRRLGRVERDIAEVSRRIDAGAPR